MKREFRGCGYGVALLSAVAKHCRDIRFSSIELNVLKSNRLAKTVYFKASFTLVEDLPMCVVPSLRLTSR